MQHRHYKTCRSLLHADDTHAECVMLGEIPRWLCAQRDWLLSLQEFQSCLSALVDSFLFRERLCPSRPPIFFLPRTCEEKTAGQRIRAAGDKRAHAGSMPTCLAITTESIRLSSSPNTISVPLRLRATWSHSVWVTTNWITAFLWQLQTRKGLSGSVTDPALLPSSASRNARLRADEEFIRVMTKAVNKLGLEWSPPEEPFRSRLDKWFLPGCHQALRQRSSPFFHPWLASRTPPQNGVSGLCISPGPLERPLLAKARLDLRHGAQKEGCHDRQRGHHVLVRSDSRSVVSCINHQGSLISKRLCMLANDLLVWAQNNLRSLKATHVPGKMNHGADMLSRNNVSSGEWTLHPLCVQKIWEVCGRARVHLFASEDNSHCPIFFTKSTDALAHEWPSLLLYAFPPFALLPQVLRRVREQWHKLILIARSSPVADPLEMGPSLSSKWYDMAFTARVMGPACVAAQREPFGLPERVLNAMAEARALSTQRLYALKWSVFSTWCQDRDLNPVTSDVSVVLSFLQEMLDKERSSSTAKVYAAAIAAFHAENCGNSIFQFNSNSIPCGNSIFMRRQENESSMSSYSSTLWLTYHTKEPERALVWTIAIHESQSTLVKNSPAASTGVGQASRRSGVQTHSLYLNLD